MKNGPIWKNPIPLVIVMLALASAMHFGIIPESGTTHKLAIWGLAVLGSIGALLFPNLWAQTVKGGEKMQLPDDWQGPKAA